MRQLNYFSTWPHLSPYEMERLVGNDVRDRVWEEILLLIFGIINARVSSPIYSRGSDPR